MSHHAAGVQASFDSRLSVTVAGFPFCTHAFHLWTPGSKARSNVSERCACTSIVSWDLGVVNLLPGPGRWGLCSCGLINGHHFLRGAHRAPDHMMLMNSLCEPWQVWTAHRPSVHLMMQTVEYVIRQSHPPMLRWLPS